jgi:hypothetical protein
MIVSTHKEQRFKEQKNGLHPPNWVNVEEFIDLLLENIGKTFRVRSELFFVDILASTNACHRVDHVREGYIRPLPYRYGKSEARNSSQTMRFFVQNTMISITSRETHVSIFQPKSYKNFFPLLDLSCHF